MTHTHIIRRLAIIACAVAYAAPIMLAAVREYHIPVTDFTELVVMDGINVTYTGGDGENPRVSFTADDASASIISVEAKKEKLVLRITPEGIAAGTPIPDLRVSSSKLEKVQNNGDSTVTVTANPHVIKFKGRLEGNGSLTLDSLDATEVNLKIFTGKGVITAEGVCETVSLGNTGTGVLDAAALKAEDAKCNVLGPGCIYVFVRNRLNVTGVSGTIYYAGNPADIRSRALSVKLRPLDRQHAE